MNSYFYNPWAIPYFSSFIIGLVVLFFLLSKKNKNYIERLYVVCMSFTIFIGFSSGMCSSSLNIGEWKFWNTINTVCTLISLSTLFHFSLIEKKGMGRTLGRMWQIIYFLAGSLLLYFFVDYSRVYLGLSKVELSYFGIYGNAPGKSLPVFWMFFYVVISFTVVLACRNFFLKYKYEKDKLEKRKSSYYVLACLLPVLGFIIHFIAEVLFGFYLKFEPSIAFLSLTSAIVAYGILKGDLFDIDILVRNGFMYAITTFVLAFAFVIVEELSENFISKTFLNSDQISSILSAATVVLIFSPVKTGCRILTNKVMPSSIKMVNMQSLKSRKNLYAKQLEIAWSDGALTEKESNMLADMRLKLGISEELHEEIKKKLPKTT